MTLLLLNAVAWAQPTHLEIEAADWQLVTTTHHAATGPIELATTTIQAIDCFRGAAMVGEANPEHLLRTAMDIEGSMRWSTAGVTEARVLSTSPRALTYYQYVDVPAWTLASDRYWFLQARIHRTQDRIAMRWDRMPMEGPFQSARQEVETAHPSAIEPPINVGGWYFQSDGSTVRIEYIICSDTGGTMPRMLQNAATRQTLPNTIGDLVQEARRVGG